MPAADLTTLYDFETQIESAVVTVLEANSITAYQQRDTDNKAAPFVAVQFSPGAAMSTPHWYLHDGILREDCFDGELTFTIVTLRGATVDSHSSYRGKVRKLMSEWQTSGLNDSLSYLLVMDMVTAGSSPQIDGEENYDITTLRYRAPFQIRATGWPT